MEKTTLQGKSAILNFGLSETDLLVGNYSSRNAKSEAKNHSIEKIQGQKRRKNIIMSTHIWSVGKLQISVSPTFFKLVTPLIDHWGHGTTWSWVASELSLSEIGAPLENASGGGRQELCTVRLSSLSEKAACCIYARQWLFCVFKSRSTPEQLT